MDKIDITLKDCYLKPPDAETWSKLIDKLQALGLHYNKDKHDNFNDYPVLMVWYDSTFTTIDYPPQGYKKIDYKLILKKPRLNEIHLSDNMLTELLN